MTGRFLGKRALITGASRGIGRAVALALAEQGAELALVARSKSDLEQTDDQIRQRGAKAALLVPLDLAEGAAIDRLGGALFDRWGKLDILLGNAGLLGPLSPVAHIDPHDWEKTLDINLTANYRLIRSMEPLLRLAQAPRCAFITSSSPRSLRPFWSPYAASKAGLEALVMVWAHECENTPLRINLFEPGAVRTSMRAAAVPGEDPLSIPTPEDIIAPLLEILHESCTINGQKISA